MVRSHKSFSAKHYEVITGCSDRWDNQWAIAPKEDTHVKWQIGQIDS